MKRKIEVGMRGKCCGNAMSGERINERSGIITSIPTEDYPDFKPDGTICSVQIHRRQFVPFKKKTLHRIVTTSKGFKFEKLGENHYKDLTTGLIWFPKEKEKLTHYKAMKKFNKPEKRLSTIEEFINAELHGFRELFNDMKNFCFWSSSLYPNNSDYARVFNGYDGYSYYGDYRIIRVSVRTVGK